MPPTANFSKHRLSKHRARRIAVAVALGGGLALGVAGLAQAADTPTPSGSAAPSGQPGRPGGPGADRVHQPHLEGTVTSITDTKILITDRSGFTRQINIKSKPDGVAVGTRIHAEGTVNADKVSLDATKVTVATVGDGMRGGFGHHGGRPGGPREGGAPPPPAGSAAPSAPAPSAS